MYRESLSPHGAEILQNEIVLRPHSFGHEIHYTYFWVQANLP